MECKQLADWLSASQYTAVLTGAGMSTESGVPDFRSPSGIWRNTDPRLVATREAMEENYPLFHQFYADRIKALQEIKPHQGHYVLANWERKGLIESIATQNVDGLHQMAGSEQVIELHGSIRQVRCKLCHQEADVSTFLAGESCFHCKGRLRPGVVLFGEMLPEKAWERAFAVMKQAELVLIIGTSLEVSPVNQLPLLVPGKVVVINLEPVSHEERFDMVVRGKAGNVLRKVDACLSEK